MDKIAEPRGLIRYASMEGIEQKKKLKFRGRIAAYSMVLVALLGILAFLISTRGIVETTILRAPGLMYQENKDGTISNLYNVQILNKSYEKKPIQFKVKDNLGTIKMVGKAITVSSAELAESSFFIYIPKQNLKESSVKVELEVISNGEVIDRVKTKFLGPIIN